VKVYISIYSATQLAEYIMLEQRVNK